MNTTTIHTGRRYDDTLDITHIAALVRADLKALAKAGMLPDWKISIRISRFSMGRSIDAQVAVPDDFWADWTDRYGDTYPRPNEAARVVLDTVEDLLGEFRQTISHPFSHPAVSFYSNITAVRS
jgi:hypothetical protein